MKTQKRLFSITVLLLLCAIAGSTKMAFGDFWQDQTRDSLSSLRSAIAQAGATALTTDQETQLNTLITTFQAAQPDDFDEALEAARTAYRTAILAGDQAAAQAQAAIIVSRITELTNAKLQAEIQFQIGVLAVLRTGGQLDTLIQVFGADRVLGLIDSLGGHSSNGRHGGRFSGRH